MALNYYLIMIKTFNTAWKQTPLITRANLQIVLALTKATMVAITIKYTWIQAFQ